MTDSQNTIFADWHPHFTPEWLSRRLAEHIPVQFSGTVVDPACGAGNLLAAAALRTEATDRPDKIHFLGNDISSRAVRACRRVLSLLLPHGNFDVQKSDFLQLGDRPSPPSPAVVLMNPPFRGYGELSHKDRRQIRSTLQMKGRFNLGYAFVSRAVRLYAPDYLIALLPSNWVYSRSGWFRDELRQLNGEWEWEDVGDRAFEAVDVHLGILVWRRKRRRNIRRQKPPHKDELVAAGFEVRTGVATGADKIFHQLALRPISVGTRRPAVKGRDVARSSSVEFWVPPAAGCPDELSAFVDAVPQRILAGLRRRSCVQGRGRAIFEYHDAVPDWFTAEPKLLLPEIVTGNLRVELDSSGTKMPLHSVIAVRVPSIAVGRKLLKYLQTAGAQKRLFATAPRLNGGAVRIQVGAVRELLNGWLMSRARRATEP
jgi:predicted RNA methylase